MGMMSSSEVHRNSAELAATKFVAKPSEVHGYPTVLVAVNDIDQRGTLGHRLRLDGYNVLEAHDWADVFAFVVQHSRPIHLLLADVGMEAQVPMIKEYRSELQALVVTKPVDENDVLAKVQQLLGSSLSPCSIR
jgi:PleD family two-component response regulator